MLAILVVIGTKYACNLDHVGDQICLQSQSRRRSYMPAISVKMGTIYACNLGHENFKNTLKVIVLGQKAI